MTSSVPATDLFGQIRYPALVLEHSAVSIRLVRPVIAGLTAAGVDPTPLLEEVQLDPALLVDPDANVRHDQAIALWRRAVQITKDEAFGLHVAEGVDVSQLDVQGYTALASPTLGAGLERAGRLHRLSHETSRVGLFPEEGGAAWRHELPGGLNLPRQPAEFVLALALVISRQVTGRNIEPLAVRFAHSEPADTREHRRIFRAPVQFGAEDNALVFHQGSLNLPSLKADPALLLVLERHANDLLERLPKADTFLEKVQSLITAELRGGDASTTNIAAKLHMSVRTLARRLSALGTSHQALLDSLRQQLCESYLADRKLGIAEIGFLLGFNDASSFHRAFKRWYGTTPAEQRRLTR